MSWTGEPGDGTAEGWRFTAMRKLILTLLMALVALPATAGDRPRGIEDRPGVGEPLRFRDASGGAFRPTELVMVVPGGTLRAPLPASVATAQNEDRMDLSETPLLGELFRETISPVDARGGEVVGPVYRFGSHLVVDAAGSAPDLTRRAVVLSADLPRLGSVSYRLGRLDFRDDGRGATPGGAQLGTAYLVDGRLVIASEGGEPAWGSVNEIFQAVFN